MFLTPYGFLAAFPVALRAASDAAVTITARSAILARAAMLPAAAFDPEISRMMSEKVTVAIEATINAQHQFARLTASALRGESLPRLLRKTTAVGMAGLRPARRTVRANARRLRAGSRSP